MRPTFDGLPTAAHYSVATLVVTILALGAIVFALRKSRLWGVVTRSVVDWKSQTAFNIVLGGIAIFTTVVAVQLLPTVFGELPTFGLVIYAVFELFASAVLASFICAATRASFVKTVATWLGFAFIVSILLSEGLALLAINKSHKQKFQLITVLENAASNDRIDAPNLIFSDRSASVGGAIQGLWGSGLIVLNANDLTDLTKQQREAIVLHEYGHILNGDGSAALKFNFLLVICCFIFGALIRATVHVNILRKNSTVSIVFCTIFSLMICFSLARNTYQYFSEFGADGVACRYGRALALADYLEKQKESFQLAQHNLTVRLSYPEIHQRTAYLRNHCEVEDSSVDALTQLW